MTLISASKRLRSDSDKYANSKYSFLSILKQLLPVSFQSHYGVRLPSTAAAGTQLPSGPQTGTGGHHPGDDTTTRWN